jgi:hypothetical protein
VRAARAAERGGADAWALGLSSTRLAAHCQVFTPECSGHGRTADGGADAHGLERSGIVSAGPCGRTAYDNALAESFVDSFKTELSADRVWRTRAQLELAVVEYIGWINGSSAPPSARRSPAVGIRTAEPEQ